MVHALKPNPQNNLYEPWRWLDFFSLRNESLHMLTWLLDDGGVPANYRRARSVVSSESARRRRHECSARSAYVPAARGLSRARHNQLPLSPRTL